MMGPWATAFILNHTIQTSTDKTVYLPHRTISRQLQGKVHKCLNTRLCQGIIHPSNSLCASQVVIVHEKSGEIHLCADYRKLNSITSSEMHFLYPTLTRHYRWCIVVMSSPLLTCTRILEVGYGWRWYQEDCI